MFTKLALRNVKRQIGNYLIYYITVTLTVAFMFAIHNVIYSDQIQEQTRMMRSSFDEGLVVLSVIVSLIVAFVLGYATSFMLKLRKREFGMYLTLGMTRENVLRIFTLETILMGLAALGSGILAGLFIYQGMMAMTSYLFEMKMIFSAYSMKGLILTIVLVCIIYLMASLTSAIYLRKVKIYDLMQGEKQEKGAGRHPGFWLAVTVISLVLMIMFGIFIDGSMREIFIGGAPNAAGNRLMSCLGGLAVSLFFFHMGLARGLVYALLKMRRHMSRGTNTFTLRHLSGKMATNSVMIGIMAFLISFAVIGANAALVQKLAMETLLEKKIPFDIMASISGDSEIGLKEAKEVIETYSEIEKEFPWAVYTNGNGYLYQNFTPWSGEGYNGIFDTFIKESDFNMLMDALGREQVTLDGKFIILSNIPRALECDFSQAVLEENGVRSEYGGITDEYPMFRNTYFTALVPDKLVMNMSEVFQCSAIELKDEHYNAVELREKLSFPIGESFMRCDFQIQEFSRTEENTVSAVLILGEMYMALIFVFLTMAILALKILSGISEDKKSYEILFRLGVGVSEQKKTLFRQIFMFFFLPVAVPALMTIPTILICSRFMKAAGFEAGRNEVFASGILVLILLASVYMLYFMATYIIAKKNVVKEEN